MKTSKRKKALSPALTRYGLATGAALAATAGPASAAIIYNNTSAFTVNTGHTTYNWDVDGGGASDFQIYLSLDGPHNIYAARFHSQNGWVKASGSLSNHLEKLASGVAVGPSLGASRFGGGNQFFTFNNHATGGVTLGTEDVGYKFLLNSQVDYGWASITLAASSITFNNWAYDTTGGEINVGQTVAAVPEPGNAALGLGLLALGAVGVSAYRKRKIQNG